MSCIFCNVVEGEMPHYPVYEDEGSLAFLDVFPLSKGHTVVVPKKHAEFLLDVADGELGGLFIAVKKAMARIEEVLHPEGFNIGVNHGEVAGQTVPHVHIHIIPRWEGDGGASLHAIVKNPGDVSVEELAKLFL